MAVYNQKQLRLLQTLEKALAHAEAAREALDVLGWPTVADADVSATMTARLEAVLDARRKMGEAEAALAECFRSSGIDLGGHPALIGAAVKSLAGAR